MEVQVIESFFKSLFVNFHSANTFLLKLRRGSSYRDSRNRGSNYRGSN